MYLCINNYTLLFSMHDDINFIYLAIIQHTIDPVPEPTYGMNHYSPVLSPRSEDAPGILNEEFIPPLLIFWRVCESVRLPVCCRSPSSRTPGSVWRSEMAIYTPASATQQQLSSVSLSKNGLWEQTDDPKRKVLQCMYMHTVFELMQYRLRLF